MYLLYPKNSTFFNMAVTESDKNVHNFLMTVRPLSWACGHGRPYWNVTDSKKKLFSTWLFPDKFRYDSPKKCPAILYAELFSTWLFPDRPIFRYIWQSKKISHYFVRGQSAATQNPPLLPRIYPHFAWLWEMSLDHKINPFLPEYTPPKF